MLSVDVALRSYGNAETTFSPRSALRKVSRTSPRILPQVLILTEDDRHMEFCVPPHAHDVETELQVRFLLALHRDPMHGTARKADLVTRQSRSPRRQSGPSGSPADSRARDKSRFQHDGAHTLTTALVRRSTSISCPSRPSTIHLSCSALNRQSRSCGALDSASVTIASR